MGPLRLERILANVGLGSRADARKLVLAGRVAVDGAVVTNPATKAEARAVTVDGAVLEAPDGLFVAFHKPVGYVCSHDDRDGARVWDLLPQRWLARHPRPSTVGRLDKDSSGLLLVTDVLPLVHAFTSPRHHVAKRYTVTLDRPVRDGDALIARFAAGTLVLRGEREPCRPAELRVLDEQVLEVVLTEGRHRQLRRMLAACGYEVTTLVRTAVGPYVLGDLAPGEWRYAPLP
jgi:16S rRNA pseudouridine516 synthase